jgi:hypothetical protein
VTTSFSQINTRIQKGIAHASVEDDEYEGYFIPKQSIILGNAWYVETRNLHHGLCSSAASRKILHDPVSNPDPDAFKPERFLMDEQLNPDVQDPALSAFGFGRVRTIWIQQISTVLILSEEDLSRPMAQYGVIVYHCGIRTFGV